MTITDTSFANNAALKNKLKPHTSMPTITSYFVWLDFQTFALSVCEHFITISISEQVSCLYPLPTHPCYAHWTVTSVDKRTQMTAIAPLTKWESNQWSDWEKWKIPVDTHTHVISLLCTDLLSIFSLLLCCSDGRSEAANVNNSRHTST